ncbi:MAG: hypothetical protein COA79_03525 [Planctomycetota bacterium]|nr:MAG: hypothetical protein COA79_03525 [Planctomycetota bacterium]
MNQLNQSLLENKEFWENKSVELPKYDRKTTPIKSIAFSAGRMAFGHTGDILQDLLNKDSSCGQMLGVKTNSLNSAQPFFESDSLITQLIFENEKGKITKRIVGAVKETIFCDNNKTSDSWQTLLEFARDPAIQFATINAPEMVYGVTWDGKSEQSVIIDEKLKDDINNGTIDTDPAKWVFFALERYHANLKLAFVSCTNFSANGHFTAACMKTIAKGWEDKGYAPQGFYQYISDPTKISFPNCMIDRIAVAPDDNTNEILKDLQIDSPVVVTEKARYWVVEDKFPAGRPPFENAEGVIMEESYEEVKKYEDMKLRVLNMSHSVIAHLGVLLGYRGNYGIFKAISDTDLKSLIDSIIVIVQNTIPNPNKMSVAKFAEETIERLFNENIPDDPMRIAFGGSAKMHPRFLETYFEAKEKGADDSDLIKLLLPVAAFIRYTVGIDDDGNEYELGDDPFLNLLKEAGNSVCIGKEETSDKIKEIISHEGIMGRNLFEDGNTGENLESLVKSMLKSKGSIRSTLQEINKN